MSCGARRGVFERSIALPADHGPNRRVLVSRFRKRVAVDGPRFEQRKQPVRRGVYHDVPEATYPSSAALSGADLVGTVEAEQFVEEAVDELRERRAAGYAHWLERRQCGWRRALRRGLLCVYGGTCCGHEVSVLQILEVVGEGQRHAQEIFSFQ
jgi:hypothetical protein